MRRYKEAEKHCRQAIGIDSRRSSAYRNLGVSLIGQADYTSAAWALVESVKADSSDNRAYGLLSKLVQQQPALRIQCPWIEGALDLTKGPVSEGDWI
jgi:Flp pilus assembly protein TadD